MSTRTTISKPKVKMRSMSNRCIPKWNPEENTPNSNSATSAALNDFPTTATKMRAKSRSVEWRIMVRLVDRSLKHAKDAKNDTINQLNNSHHAACHLLINMISNKAKNEAVTEQMPSIARISQGLK